MQLILIQVEMPDPVLSERVLVEYDSACTMADAIEAYDPFQTETEQWNLEGVAKYLVGRDAYTDYVAGVR